MVVRKALHNSHEAIHLSPAGRLFQLLLEERKDLIALCLYVALGGLLSLAVPLAAQALVNTIAAGVFLQPLFVLTTVVFVCLILAGIMRLLKLTLLERLQKRVFARVAVRVAAHLPRVEHSAFLTKYAPQLVNRFFDVLTIQKTISKILMDGPTAVLQVAIGLTLLAFYSPYLLAFDAFIILFLVFCVFVLGINGLRTSINESYKKYHVAEWLEEIGRCQINFKTYGRMPFIVGRTDDLVMEYIEARRAHFRVIFRQAVAHYLFRAVASAGVLAVGGWLVINRELTLGQLVAANLIVVSVVAAIEKLLGLLESGYDLLTALDKVGYLTDLPVESDDTRRTLLKREQGASIVCRNMQFSYFDDAPPVLANLDLTVKPGERISIVGKSGAGKSTLATILCGLLEPVHGAVLLDKMDIRDINREDLRETVALVGSHSEVFEGTIEENILIGRNFSHDELMSALATAQLSDELTVFPRGIKTKVISEGRNLSSGQIQRLLIARAIIGRPRLLILDEAFASIDEQDKLQILDHLFAPEQTWTIIDISHDPEVVLRASTIYVLADGRIIESTTPEQIKHSEQTAFCRLFPTLAAVSTNATLAPATAVR